MINEIKEILVKNGLKITPQRLAVLEAFKILNHPSADAITEYIKNVHPNIAVGTIYKTLETFTELGIVKKVKTDDDKMRYDAVLERHHHLYCAESNRIEDFYDEELNKILDKYFKKKSIPNFNISDIKLQIIGNFNSNNHQK